MLAVAAMQFVVISLVTSMDAGPILKILLEQLPERFQALITEQLLVNLSVKGATAFGFQHPIVIVLLTINAINFPNRHIVGEMESGALEWVLAYPFQRTTFLLSLWTASASLLFLISASGFAASVLTLAFNHDLNFSLFQQMLKIASNLWLLFVFITSFTLLLSTFAKVGSKIAMFSAGFVLVSYFLNVLSALWSPLDFLNPVNVFTYYQPQKLMFDQVSFWLHVSVLAILTFLSLFISIRQFNRRDIPA